VQLDKESTIVYLKSLFLVLVVVFVSLIQFGLSGQYMQYDVLYAIKIHPAFVFLFSYKFLPHINLCTGEVCHFMILYFENYAVVFLFSFNHLIACSIRYFK